MTTEKDIFPYDGELADTDEGMRRAFLADCLLFDLAGGETSPHVIFLGKKFSFFFVSP